MTVDLATFDAVLFDMDGTLIDTERLWLDTAAGIIAAHGGTPPDPLRYAGATTEEYLRLLAADIGRELEPGLFDESLASRYERVGIQPMSGAIELLDRLTTAGIPLALVTSSDRAAVDAALPVLGHDRFRAIVSADDVARHKPDPEPYLLAAALLGVDPGRCIVVEDSPMGVAAGHAAGCHVLAVPALAPIPAAPGRTVIGSLLELPAPGA